MRIEIDNAHGALVIDGVYLSLFVLSSIVEKPDRSKFYQFDRTADGRDVLITGYKFAQVMVMDPAPEDAPLDEVPAP